MAARPGADSNAPARASPAAKTSWRGWLPWRPRECTRREPSRSGFPGQPSRPRCGPGQSCNGTGPPGAPGTPQRWTPDFAVFLDGEPVGAQGLSAVGFPVRREVATGSWLGLPYQRQGLGKEMRAAVLVLAFAHLGALSAVTGAFTDNIAAIKVSRALGYHDDRQQVADRDGARVLARRFRLTAPPDMQRWPLVTVSGADDEFLGMCGATDPAGHQALPLGGYPHA